MVNRLVSVGDDFKLPAAVKVEDTNLPARLGATTLNATIATATEGKLDEAEAAESYAAVKSARFGNRVVFWGDSITKGADFIATEISRAVSWPTYASIMSRQRINYVHNAGVSGNTTTQMLARFATDVAAKNPNVVTIMAGTNDLGAETPATARTNIAEMVRLVRSIGATPVLFTIMPALGATPATRRAEVIKLNTWIRDFAARQGITLIDTYGQIVDPATGGFLAAYSSGDFIHPNAAGYAMLGKYVADTLAPLLSMWSPPLPQDNADPNNLIPNGMFLTDADVNSIPDGWSNQAGVTGQAVSLIPATGDAKGNWFQYDLTASSADSQLFRSVTAGGLVAGHKYVFLGRVQSEGLAGNAAAYVRLRWTATANRDDIPVNVLPHNIADGIFYCEITAPPGVTAAQVSLQAKAGTGKVRFAQVGLYDLTAAGVS